MGRNGVKRQAGIAWGVAADPLGVEAVLDVLVSLSPIIAGPGEVPLSRTSEGREMRVPRRVPKGAVEACSGAGAERARLRLESEGESLQEWLGNECQDSSRLGA